MCARADIEFTEAGHFGGRTSAVETQGGYVYYNQGKDLVVRDTTKGLDVARIRMPGSPQKLIASSAYLYAACADGGFAVLSIANPALPSLISRVPLAGFVQSFALAEPYAFVVAANRALFLVDVSDHTHPRLVSTVYEDYYVEDAVASGPTLYLSDGINGLRVYDISTTNNPVLIGKLANVRYNGRILAAGSYLYDSLNDGGLAIYDVTTRSAPKEISFKKIPGRAGDIELAGETLYLSNRGGGLILVDVSNPAAPEVLSQPSYPANDGRLSQTTFYLASDLAGLYVLDVTRPRSPAVKDRYRTVGVVRAVQVISGSAYVTDFHNGFSVLDVSSPSAIRVAASFDIADPPLAAAVADGRAYVACGTGGLKILSVGGTSLALLGTYAPSCQAVAISGKNAVLARGDQGIELVDVSNPAAPTRAGSLPLSGWVDQLVVRGGMAYVGNGSDLFVVNIATPAKPVLVRRVTLAGTYGLTTQTHFLFTTGLGTLSVFDLTRPSAPRTLATTGLSPPQYVRSLSVSGGRAFLARRFSGVDAYDVSNRANPVLLDTYTTDYDAVLAYWAKPYLYVCDGRDGGVTLISVVGP